MKTVFHLRQCCIFSALSLSFYARTGEAGAVTPSAKPAMQSLLIAPLIGGEYFCDEAVNDVGVSNEEAAALYCASIEKNAGDRITAALDTIGPKVTPSGKYRLGYTLIASLMRYYVKRGDQWQLDI